MYDEIPEIEQNGVITEYEVQFVPALPENRTRLFNFTELVVNATGLDEHVLYNVTVRAYTSAGPGPYSDPVEAMTFQDSESFISSSFLMFIQILFFVSS